MMILDEVNERQKKNMKDIRPAFGTIHAVAVVVSVCDARWNLNETGFIVLLLVLLVLFRLFLLLFTLCSFTELREHRMRTISRESFLLLGTCVCRVTCEMSHKNNVTCNFDSVFCTKFCSCFFL